MLPRPAIGVRLEMGRKPPGSFGREYAKADIGLDSSTCAIGYRVSPALGPTADGQVAALDQIERMRCS